VGSQKSVILVTVDCLRADHVGFVGYEPPTTPFLDSLAAGSFVFPAAVVAGAPTYYSLPAIIASRYPLALGRDLIGISPEEPTLASTLQGAGYATACFAAANPYISSRFGYEKGFDTFRDFLDAEPVASSNARPSTARNGLASALNRKLRENSHRLGPIGSVYEELYFQYCQRLATAAANSLDILRRFPAADVIVDQARTWLASIGDRPFFLWLHFMDPHSPYYPTEKAFDLMGYGPITPFRARYLNSYWNRSDLEPQRLARHRDEIVALYDAGIRWVDAQIARLIEALNRFNRWDSCILAVTADHGEEFLDHGGRYHPPSSLREELIQVPLLLRVPGTVKTQLSRSPFSLLHLAPTLLDAAGVPIPSAFRGRSHWGKLRQGESWNEIAISESVAGCTNPFRLQNRLGPRALAVRDGRFKLLLQFDPPAEYFYDLETDAGEKVSLPQSAEKPARRRLLEAAREHLQHSISDRDPAARVSARLRDLRLEWQKPTDKTSPVSS
jgi:arylsulfatase A-like enzyme